MIKNLQISLDPAYKLITMNEQPSSFYFYLFNWIFSGLAFLFTSKLIKGFDVNGFFSALFAALLLGLANTFVWPILFFLTLPINILTLGLFTFVVNGAVLKIVAAFLPGFEIKSWFAAIFGAIFLSIVNAVFHFVLMPFFSHPQAI